MKILYIINESHSPVPGLSKEVVLEHGEDDNITNTMLGQKANFILNLDTGMVLKDKGDPQHGRVYSERQLPNYILELYREICDNKIVTHFEDDLFEL